MNDSAIVTGDEKFDNVPCAEDGLDGSSLAADSGIGDSDTDDERGGL